MYLELCTPVKIYKNGKICREYFVIRNFFVENVSTEQIQLIFDYLNTLYVYRPQNMQQLFRNAKKYLQNCRDRKAKEIIKSMNVQPYKEYSLDDILKER
jgi:hypothetical protein